MSWSRGKVGEVPPSIPAAPAKDAGDYVAARAGGDQVRPDPGHPGLLAPRPPAAASAIVVLPTPPGPTRPTSRASPSSVDQRGQLGVVADEAGAGLGTPTAQVGRAGGPAPAIAVAGVGVDHHRGHELVADPVDRAGCCAAPGRRPRWLVGPP